MDVADRFFTWPEVMAYARAGLPLFYKASLDKRAVRIEYEVKARSLKVFPPGSRGRGKARTADPFTADKGHLERMRRAPHAEGVHADVERRDFGTREMSTYPRAVGQGPDSHHAGHSPHLTRHPDETTRRLERLQDEIDLLRREAGHTRSGRRLADE